MALHRLGRNKTAVFSLAVLLLLSLLALLAPWVAPYSPYELQTDEDGRVLYLQPPSTRFLLGTDAIGRDVLSRLLYGGRATLSVAVAAVAISLGIGVLLGLVAGFYGGAVDTVIMRLVDILLAFPRTLLALAVVAVLGVGLKNVMLAIGIAGITGYARVVRGSVLSAKEHAYVEAARSVGSSNGRILVRHLLPNVVAPVIVLATLDVAYAILSASSLSFLGLGAQPPTPEWGLMLYEGREYLHDALWVTMAPGLAIMATVLAANMFGDGLRDALDPRLWGGQGRP